MRLLTLSSFLLFRRKNTPGNTLRQNPVFGDGDGGTANPTFDKEAEPPQPWNNPVRRTRPPITQLQTDPAREGDEGDDDSSTLKTEPTLDSDSGRGTSSAAFSGDAQYETCLLYTSPSPRDRQKSRMPSSA